MTEHAGARGGWKGGSFHMPVTIRRVEIDRSGHWLAAGWRDFRRAPNVSLVYGGLFTIASFFLTIGLLWADMTSLILPLAGGFVLLAPLAVVGLYDVSRRLERGDRASLHFVWAAFRDNLGQLSAMGVVLLVIWFVWVEVAIMLFAVVFGQMPPPLTTFFQDVFFSREGALLLIFGTVVGGGFALSIFAITAVSIPLLFDRPVDVFTAIAVSLLTVRANWKVMFGWAAMAGLVTAVGMASFYLGLAVALPVLAYATWHCYRDLVEPEQDVPPPGADLGAGI